MLTGIYKPTTGTIKLDGVDMVGLNPISLRDRGLPELSKTSARSLNASVADNVKMAHTMHNDQNLAKCFLRTPGMVKSERELDEKVMGLLGLWDWPTKQIY